MMLHIYIVEAGDTLWSIAKQHLGKAARYQEIVRLNGLKTATLTAGQALQLPSA